MGLFENGDAKRALERTEALENRMYEALGQAARRLATLEKLQHGETAQTKRELEDLEKLQHEETAQTKRELEDLEKQLKALEELLGSVRQDSERAEKLDRQFEQMLAYAGGARRRED